MPAFKIEICLRQCRLQRLKEPRRFGKRIWNRQHDCRVQRSERPEDLSVVLCLQTFHGRDYGIQHHTLKR